VFSWKIVSQQVDPGLEDSVPDSPARSSKPQSAPAETNAERTMIRIIHRFFDALFVNRDHEAAFRFFVSSSYACLSLALVT